MPAQVMRTEARSAGGGIGPHVEGISRPDSATPRPGLDPVLILEQHREAAAEAIRTAPRRSGPKPKPRAEFLFAGPPRYGATDEWSADRVQAWARDCVEWLKRTYRHSVIEVAALHQDEASPHVHVLIVPRDERGFVGLRAAHAAQGVDVTSRLVFRRHGTVLQDSFHREVGRKHGLSRGTRGSNRKHQRADSRLARERARLEKREREIDDREERVDRDRGNFTTSCSEAGNSLQRCLETVRSSLRSLTNSTTWHGRQLALLAAAIRTARDHCANLVRGRAGGDLTWPRDGRQRHAHELALATTARQQLPGRGRRMGRRPRARSWEPSR